MATARQPATLHEIEELIEEKRATKELLKTTRLDKYYKTGHEKYRLMSMEEQILSTELNRLRAAKHYRLKATKKRKEKLETIQENIKRKKSEL